MNLNEVKRGMLVKVLDSSYNLVSGDKGVMVHKEESGGYMQRRNPWEVVEIMQPHYFVVSYWKRYELEPLDVIIRNESEVAYTQARFLEVFDETL
jgi:hypothetical protein